MKDLTVALVRSLSCAFAGVAVGQAFGAWLANDKAHATFSLVFAVFCLVLRISVQFEEVHAKDSE